MDLKNKKIIFITPRFYHYDDLIKRKLEGFGAKVTLIHERFYGVKHLVLSHLGQRFYSFVSKKRYNVILEKLNEHYDYLFIIRGESLPVEFVKSVKAKNKNIKTIMYQWDSLVNHDYSNLLPEIDFSFSFDKKDCESIKDLNYKPLFYTKIMENKDRKLDLLVVSTYLRERYYNLLELQRICESENIKYKIYMYTPKARFYMERIFHNVKISCNFLYHSYLSEKELNEYYRITNCIMDISNGNQSGLSMRVIESIGAQCKLITTNKNIIKEDFYNSNNIAIVSSMDEVADKIIELNKTDFIANGSIDKMYIDNWLKDFFEITNAEG